MSLAFTPHAATAWADAIEASASDAAAGAGLYQLRSAASAAFFADMLVMAAELMADFATGQVALIRVAKAETGDPLNPYATTPTPYGRNAYVGGYPANRIDGERIQASDLRVIFDAEGLPIRPSLDDVLTIDGAVHAIVQAAAVPAAGPAVLHILQARAGA